MIEGEAIMKLVKKSDGQPYDAKGHFGVWSIRKIDAGQEGRRMSISISCFLPGGGVDMSSSPMERAYFVISGSLTVKGKSETYPMGPGDMIYIGPDEDRSIVVTGTEPATILVVLVKP